MAARRDSLLRLWLLFHYVRLFTRPILLLLILLVVGSAGYVTLEGFTPFEGLYMTVISITTVGFSEVRPLSDAGRAFTICLILGGVLFYGLGINAVIQIILERGFRGFMEAQVLTEKLKSIHGHYIVCGGGRMALAICTELEKAGRDFLVIEKNSESPVSRLVSERKAGWVLLAGDALSEEVLREARIDRARGLFSVLPTDADNLFVVLSARGLNPTIWIETRIAHESTRAKMVQAGANRVVSPYHVAGIQMARSMLKPQVDDFIEIFKGDRNYEFEVRIHRLAEGDEAVGKNLGACRFIEQGFSVVALQNVDGTMVYAPPPETPMRAGMSVFLLGKGRS
ncbi:MAG: potassium channel protein [Turneriella sp.]